MTDALRTDFAPLLDIRRAAVVGASDRGPGYTLLENLSAHGGEVIGVHPKREEAAGHRCVPSIADVPSHRAMSSAIRRLLMLRGFAPSPGPSRPSRSIWSMMRAARL